MGGHLALGGTKGVGGTEGMGGTPYLVLHVQGAAFALHQIRHMIGGAIAVAQGTVPADVMRIALHTPFQVAAVHADMHMPLSCIHHYHAYAVRVSCINRACTAQAPCMRHACAHAPL